MYANYYNNTVINCYNNNNSFEIISHTLTVVAYLRKKTKCWTSKVDVYMLLFINAPIKTAWNQNVSLSEFSDVQGML